MKIKRLVEFKEIKSFLSRRGCNIDGFVFRLHYRATVIILFGFCMMVMAKQFIGQPMECMSKSGNGNEKDQFDKVVNRFCFISSTFSLNSAWDKTVGEEVPYPGIENAHKSRKKNEQPPYADVTFHAFYQWVCYVLLFQAIIFYLPHIFWKRSESSLTRRLQNGLEQFVMSDEERKEKVDSVSEYLLQTSGHHDYLFLYYLTAEILNLMNIVAQLMFVDRFLGGQFSTYGLDVLRWEGEWWQFPITFDPMMKVFPRMTKCRFNMFGSSGDVQKLDVLCVLPINIINEKGYLLLWFWFHLLLILTIFSFLHTILLLFFPFLRVISLKYSGGKMTAKRHIERVLAYSGGRVGDYFLLHLLSKNITKENFAELMHQLAVSIAEKEKML